MAFVPDAGLAFHRMRAEEAVVPCPWWFEVRNILVVNERRGRVGESDSAAFLLQLERSYLIHWPTGTKRGRIRRILSQS